MRQNWWQQHRWAKWVLALGTLAILVGGFGMYRNWRNAQVTNRPITGKVTTETTRDTLKTDPIKQFSQHDFLHYRQAAFVRHVDQYPTGYLIIKRPGIRLPIYDRSNNYTLALGVGKSYFLDSQMGKGNYVLAGHNMEQPGVLLSNLYQVQIGDKMTISNAKSSFHYRVTVKHTVGPNVKLINGKAVQGSAYYLPTQKEKPLLTVYTCADGGANRLVVQGQYLNKTDK